MSGTGQFRNVRNGSWADPASTAAREHLGDRLAAFVDGELGDDARDRVQSHLATCELCKAEAEEQRRLKNAVADALPPALSAGLLARLQGLPGGDPGGPGDPDSDAPGPFGRTGFGGGDAFGSRGVAKSYLAPAGEPLDGFPIHDFHRTTASRGRRLAFAAAGAFSLAALALGGALPLDAAFEGSGPPEPAPGTASTPLNMNQADGRSTADPGATPLSATVTQTLPGPAGGQSPMASTRAQEVALSPSPSAQRAAGLSQGGRNGRSGVVTPSALPVSTPVLTAQSVAPVPMPLLGGIEGTLSAPLPGGHAR